MDLNQIALIALIAAGGVLALVLAWVAIKYRAYIAAKVTNATADGILARLGDFVFKVVTELNQTIVEQLKKDAKWNKEEAEKVKQLAIARVKSYLGAAGIKELMTVLGITESALTDLIVSAIESQVSLVKVSA